MDEKTDWNLITQYLLENYSIDEKKSLELWLNSNPTEEKNWDELNWIVKGTDQISMLRVLIQSNIDSDWGQLVKKMHSKDITSRQVKRKPGLLEGINGHANYSVLEKLLKVAVLIIFIIGGSLLFYTLYDTEKFISYESPFREISTKTSQLANIELLDGTKLNLSVESTLRLPNDFDRGSRVIYMEGQALFDVYTNPSKPFIVETKHAVISVLGTNFSVRAYPDDNFVEVSVLSGSVALEYKTHLETETFIIETGKHGRLDIQAGGLTVRSIDNNNYLKWVDGKIVIDNATLKEVCQELRRWFGADFKILDKELNSSSKRLTAVFDNRSLNHILDVISYTLNIDFIREDNIIMFKNKNQ